MATRRVEDTLVIPRDMHLDRTDEQIHKLTALPDGRLVSLSGYGPAIWYFKTHSAKRLYEQPIGQARLALLLPDGRFALALQKGGIKLWNPKTDRVEVTLKGRGDRTTGLVATRDGRLSRPRKMASSNCGISILQRRQSSPGMSVGRLLGPTLSLVPMWCSVRMSRSAGTSLSAAGAKPGSRF